MRSKDLISFSVNGLPTSGKARPCDCARTAAGMATASTMAGISTLNKERIGNAPILVHFARLLRIHVDGARLVFLLAPLIHRDAPELAQLGERRLKLALVVGGARDND